MQNGGQVRSHRRLFLFYSRPEQDNNYSTTAWVFREKLFHIFPKVVWFPLKFDLINVTGMLQAHNGAAKHAMAL